MPDKPTLVGRKRDTTAMPPPEYAAGEKIATRKAYGKALRKLGEVNEAVVALDGEVKNSTYSQEFAEAFPDRFIECYIAEQNMAGMALGMSALGKIPFVSTFACFLTRACDQIRMAGISRGNVKFCGSHCGVSIGQDGPSQMGLEGPRVLPRRPGLDRLLSGGRRRHRAPRQAGGGARGHRLYPDHPPRTPVIYQAQDVFVVGGSHTVKQSDGDRATIVAAGVTLFEALEAAGQLEEKGIHVRVIDAYSIKPLDAETIRRAASETGAIVTVEDHYPEGGLGEAVAGVLAGQKIAFHMLAVTGIPRSGSPGRLMDAFGISARRIREAVETITSHSPKTDHD